MEPLPIDMRDLLEDPLFLRREVLPLLRAQQFPNAQLAVQPECDPWIGDVLQGCYLLLAATPKSTTPAR